MGNPRNRGGSFSDSAEEVLDRAEASLRSLMIDARNAKASHEVAAIAALTKSIAAIRTKGSREDVTARTFVRDSGFRREREMAEGDRTTGRPERRRTGLDRRTGEARRKEHRGPPGGIEGRKVERRARRERRLIAVA